MKNSVKKEAVYNAESLSTFLTSSRVRIAWGPCHSLEYYTECYSTFFFQEYLGNIEHRGRLKSNKVLKYYFIAIEELR